MALDRRTFLAATGAALSAAAGAQTGPAAGTRIGVEIGSINANKWTAYQFLDYLQGIGVGAAQFSAGTLGVNAAHPDEEAVHKIRDYAGERGIVMAVFSGGSICPSSTQFNPKAGTPEEQIVNGLRLCKLVGASALRVTVGMAKERAQIEMHAENTANVLKPMRQRILDSGVKLAMENHGGDWQARELKALIEEVGPDVLGVCLDSGNPLWMMEDPHLTLDLLGPYAYGLHLRDSAVWRVPEGVAVRWVNMGEGNVDIDGWLAKFVKMKPGMPVTLENLVSGAPRILKIFEKETFAEFPKMPASELSRFLALAERGKPLPAPAPRAGADRGPQQCADLEVSVRYTRELLKRV